LDAHSRRKPLNPWQGKGFVHGEKISARARARDARSRDPMRVHKPLSITNMDSTGVQSTLESSGLHTSQNLLLEWTGVQWSPVESTGLCPYLEVIPSKFSNSDFF
jgi:hypothetical protein